MTVSSNIMVGESEPLAFAAGLDAIKNVVLDASLVTPDATGRRILRAGTFLTKSRSVSPTGKDQMIRYQGAGKIEGVLALDWEFINGTNDADAAVGMFFHGCVFRAANIVDYSLYGLNAASTLVTCKFETNL